MSETTKTQKGKHRGYFKGNKGKAAAEPKEDKPEEVKKEEPKDEPPKTKSQPVNDTKSKGPPPPRHLATKQTPLTNDPIYQQSFIVDGDRGFIPGPRAKYFSPSCDSFLPLVHADYANIVAANRSFGKAVSVSTYAYYNIMHLWARLFAVMRHRRELTPTERDFLSRLEHEDSLPVSEPINTYLRCLGDFKDTTGTMHKMRVTKPNNKGDFGRISAKTHNLYEAFPAPRIALQRIRNDVFYSQGDLEHPMWEIPDLRPLDAENARDIVTGEDNVDTDVDESDEDTTAQGEQGGNAVDDVQQDAPPARESESGVPPVAGTSGTTIRVTTTQQTPQATTHRDLPTVNLLGWYPSEKLSSNQLQPLRKMMGGEDFSISIVQLQYVADIMRHVAKNLTHLTNYKTASALHESCMGSVSQEAFLTIDRWSTEFRRKDYFSDGMSYVQCLSGLDVRCAGGMRVFGLRIRKDQFDDLNPWACYDFGLYKHVPNTWIRNRNDLFATGMEILSYAEQTTSIADREQYREQFLRAAIVRTNRA